MPEIRPPYTISDLPQTSSKLDVRSAMHCGSSSIYFGISHSSLAAYSLKSTPKLLWTHAVSPVTNILAVQAVPQANSDSQALYFSTINKYNAGSLRRIVIQSDDKQEEQVLLEKCDAIIDIRASQDRDHLYLLSKNGDVQCVSVAQEPASVVWTIKNTESASQVLFHEHLASNQDDMPADGVFVTVLKSSAENSTSKAVQVRLVALDETRGQELVNSTIETNTNTGVFGLHMGSLLLFDSHVFLLSTYSLPSLALVSTIRVRRNDKTPTEKASLLPVGKNRILLSYDNTLKLVDTKYSTILSKRVLEIPIQLAAFSQKNALAIGFTDSGIVCVPVEPGTGSLLESLGKGVVSEKSNWSLKHSLFLCDQELETKDFIEKQALAALAEKSDTLSVLNKIWNLLKSGQFELYENWTIAYLKYEKEFIGEGIPKVVERANGETLIYSHDLDREVDPLVLSYIVGQVFANKNLPLDQIDPAELHLPATLDKLIVYLLTHPLFPATEFPNLLAILSSNPRLYRQAIVTAPGLLCNQIVSALQASNNDTFRDAITRLTEEFSVTSITESVKSVFKVTNEAGQEESHLAPIAKCVERMQNLDVGWSIMSCFIDAGGLFAWDEQTLNTLEAKLETEVKNLTASSETLIILEESLKFFGPSQNHVEANVPVDGGARKPRSKKDRASKDKERYATGKREFNSFRQGPEVVSVKAHNLSRVRSLLSFEGSSKTGLNNSELRENFSRTISPYTLEKLILN